MFFPPSWCPILPVRYLVSCACVLGLSVVACSSGDGAGGTGGGGTGGLDFGPCYDDASVYDGLEYADGGGEQKSGSQASLAIRDECVLGSTDSVPVNLGCPREAQAVLACPRDCPPETIQALSECVAGCVQDVVERITGSTLSEECVDCYGAEAPCTVANCANWCITDPSSPACIQCRCVLDCTPEFERCSGLPPSGDCG